MGDFSQWKILDFLNYKALYYGETNDGNSSMNYLIANQMILFDELNAHKMEIKRHLIPHFEDFGEKDYNINPALFFLYFLTLREMCPGEEGELAEKDLICYEDGFNGFKILNTNWQGSGWHYFSPFNQPPFVNQNFEIKNFYAIGDIYWMEIRNG